VGVEFAGKVMFNCFVSASTALVGSAVTALVVPRAGSGIGAGAGVPVCFCNSRWSRRDSEFAW
jgi:hypothetical protein